MIIERSKKAARRLIGYSIYRMGNPNTGRRSLKHGKQQSNKHRRIRQLLKLISKRSQDYGNTITITISTSKISSCVKIHLKSWVSHINV